MPKIRKHTHLDGRVCYFYTFDGKWRHWDHDHVPGPRERIEYLCEREH